jgi:hypothetical protein
VRWALEVRSEAAFHPSDRVADALTGCSRGCLQLIERETLTPTGVDGLIPSVPGIGDETFRGLTRDVKAFRRGCK